MEQTKINEILASVYSPKNKERMESDYERYKIFNGQLKEIIRDAIYKEFQLYDTIKEMVNRIVPINITSKIIQKLAKVYSGQVLRAPENPVDADKDALEFYEEYLEIDKQMKLANRYFKLFKHVMIEPYFDRYGVPKIRVMPSFTYSLYSDDIIEPNQPTEIIKHLVMTPNDKTKDIHVITNNEEVITVTGDGIVLSSEPNEYGVSPYTLIKDNDEELLPIQDDDLISMQKCICLLLTDLSYASKYQSWSLFVLIGAKTDRPSFNPNAIIHLERDADGNAPSLDAIKPTLDSDAMLRQVEALLGMLLTTKSLSIGSVSTTLTTTNTASGVAKILDQAETTEEKTDQVAYFSTAEKSFWYKFAHSILPVWKKNGSIMSDFIKTFTEVFKLAISFPDQSVVASEKDRIETIALKLKNGLISQKLALKETNPEMSEEQLDELQNEINQERAEMFANFPQDDNQSLKDAENINASENKNKSNDSASAN